MTPAISAPLSLKRVTTSSVRRAISEVRRSPVAARLPLTRSPCCASAWATVWPVSAMVRVTSRAPDIRPSVSTPPVRSSSAVICWERSSSSPVTVRPACSSFCAMVRECSSSAPETVSLARVSRSVTSPEVT